MEVLEIPMAMGEMVAQAMGKEVGVPLLGEVVVVVFILV